MKNNIYIISHCQNNFKNPVENIVDTKRKIYNKCSILFFLIKSKTYNITRSEKFQNPI
jgi:hypothetical protein